MAHRSDSEHIRSTRNASRFFVEHHAIAWLLMGLTILWGIYGHSIMPQRKDPKTPVREAMVMTEWPGARAEQVEDLVTKKVEEVLDQNGMVTEIRSSSRAGQSVVTFELDEFHAKDTDKEFDDIGIKLAQIAGLPDGAGPVQYIKDFGDTSALMLTIASPPVSAMEISLRARQIEPLIDTIRREKTEQGTPVSLVICFPDDLDTTDLKDMLQLLSDDLLRKEIFSSLQVTFDRGVAILNGTSEQSDATISNALDRFAEQHAPFSELDPDIWFPVVVRTPVTLETALRQAGADKYSYRELDNYTDQIARSLQQADEVTKVDRAGVLGERLSLTFDSSRLASLNVSPLGLPEAIRGRNRIEPGGEIEAGSQRFAVTPGGVFRRIDDLMSLPLSLSDGRGPSYLRDLVSLNRGYDSPPTFLNFLNYRDANGQWRRGRAITISVQMRSGRKIEDFSRAVDAKLRQIQQLVPSDLIIARTSDQPRQVRENVGLFTTSLWEAIGLVVAVSLVGFWDWRSALVMAVSIPITLAMTVGMMAALGIDLQQVSIASLIIALGLLVDDPVVAGDAIQRELASGHAAGIAGWLGPTKLARAILFATITNILAYLPFLLLHGDTGEFIFSLPLVITCSLIASRIVSMTFVPLMGQLLLRNRPESSTQPRSRFSSAYYRVGRWAIEHRRSVLAGSFLLLILGGLLGSRLQSSFFPDDLQYLSYADIWLPEGATFAETNAVSQQVEQIIRQVSARYAKDAHRETSGTSVLKSVTSFVGAGGPRFWDSVSPEAPALNYAEVVIETLDKRDTNALVPLLQAEIDRKVAGARVDVRHLETGPPIAAPVAIRILGPDIAVLRHLSGELESIFRAVPSATRIRDDWGDDRVAVGLQVDPNKAAIAGITNHDIAQSTAMNTSGLQVGTLYDRDKTIPIVLRQRLRDRSRIADVQNQYVYSTHDGQRIPLPQIASANLSPELGVIRHFNRSRAITVSCYPVAGMLASNVLDTAMPQIEEFEKHLPAGYSLLIAGEYKAQNSGFSDLAVALSVSILAIYLALMLQFRNIVKPLIVFAAIPFGCIGAFAGLYLMGQPFGFMAFLGIASLMGVIVSHIIVLFDYIEEQREQGEALFEAILDAGLLRLRPVLITVGATVFALLPLAAHGGPLWQPLCYAQIGGLIFSTLVTLILVPTLYAFAVLDLRWIPWTADTSALASLTR